VVFLFTQPPLVERLAHLKQIPDGRGRNTLRLNFVSETPERIREGMAVLAAVIRETS
jgi:DNA-binding transcriptional MocR family regulator